MNVVVTGAAGFIGSHVCERLVKSGHRVLGIDSFDDTCYPASTKRAVGMMLGASCGARFRLIEADVCDAGAVARAIGPEVDAICHLAALAGLRSSFAEPMLYLRANVVGTGVILERMRAVGLRRLVIASSSAVYAAPGSDSARIVPSQETDPWGAPTSPYSATKLMNEVQCSTYRELWGIGVSVLRYFTVYGPRQRPDMAISRFTRAIQAGARLMMYGDGSSRRDYTYVDDIAVGTVAAAERVVPGQFEIYNLGGGKTMTLLELIGSIERTVGRSALIDQCPIPAGDTLMTLADIRRARAELGYQPKTTIDVGIAAYWDWLRAHT